jgi:hypothetical protein
MVWSINQNAGTRITHHAESFGLENWILPAASLVAIAAYNRTQTCGNTKA